MKYIDKLLLEMTARRSSDLHIKVGNLSLTPIALMPPFGDGPQWRTTWFQLP